MAASFPGAIKTFVAKVLGEIINIDHVNDLQDEVNAIETELGTNPSGTETTVKDRFDQLDADLDIGTIGNYWCRAWVNFDGTGTVAIRASGNVTSITDNGTGNYTVNFTNAMTDADYVVSILISPNYGAPGGGPNYVTFTTDGSTEQAPTTTTFRFTTYVIASGNVDPKYVNCAIFR